MMHSNFFGGGFCGTSGLFSGFHFGGFFHLLFWAILIFLLVKAVSYLLPQRNSQGRHGTSSTSLTILEERYASGDIDQEEFLQRKKDILN